MISDIEQPLPRSRESLRAEIEQLKAERSELYKDRSHSMLEIEQLKADKDEAYRQRNHLVAAMAHLFPSGIRATDIEGWEPDWNGCVYVDLPTGQISYHYHDSQASLFANLPPYTKPWDCHDKDVVHSRLAALEAKL